MPHQAVLFDLDGTLADTLMDIAYCMNHVLGQFNLPGHAVPVYRNFVGDGVRLLVERALPPGQKHRTEQVLEVYLPYLIEHGADNAELYPGIANLLDSLTARGIALAVCSNKPHASTVDVVGKLMGDWSFAVVQGHTEPFEKKPAPDMALHICKQIGVEPADCLFVGDSDVDMQTAANAGMIGVGVAWGFRGAAEVRTAGAGHLIDQPMDLMSLLDGPGR